MVRFREGASFGARPIVGRPIAAVMMSIGLVAGLGAQGLPAPITRVSMDDAVRLTLGLNQALRAQRLTIDMAKADETTAEQKPKFNVTFGAEGFPTFSQQQLTLNSLGNLVSYSGALGYTFERGGRRDKRTTVRWGIGNPVRRGGDSARPRGGRGARAWRPS